MTTKLPFPKIKQRTIDEKREASALEGGLDPVLAKIVAARPFIAETLPQELLSPKLKTLDAPNKLADMDKAARRLIEALDNNEVIGIETDHDCDGQTSHAVLYCALTAFLNHPADRVRSYIGHRLKEGYGLSEPLTKRILADNPRPSLVITADNGSSDEAQIAWLKKEGIDVIVTDHHEIPVEGIPASAYAVINPTRDDSDYPDRYIAGCMVAWLFMAATRQQLVNLRGKDIPSLGACLDFVAVGTIADCVSIARSRNNRAVVSYGMKLIQKGLRPCWRAILPLVSVPLSSEDLGFKIGPLLNSDGRLSCAFGSVSFLLAPDDADAKRWVEYLQVQNVERRAIQDKITQLALSQASRQRDEGNIGLCIFLEEGHAGVHGISASRVKDAFGCPTIIFCPKADNPELLTGSARSIEGVHLRNVLQEISHLDSQLIERFGGHAGAAGLTLYRKNLAKFQEIFEKVLRKEVNLEIIGPVIWTDGELPMEKLDLPFVEKLVSELEPFGREFEPPLFEAYGKILSLTPIGQTKTHARVGIVVEELWFEAVWFNCRQAEEQPMPVALEDEIKFVFSPKLQTFRGEKKLNCQIIHLEKITSQSKVPV